MQENFEWYFDGSVWRKAEQRKKFYENLQIQLNEEFDKTHNKIVQDSKLKDKGTLRNINNYRMKLWCDMFIEYKKNSLERSFAASCATKDLEMFDLQFNQ